MLEEKLERRNIKPTAMRILVLQELISCGHAMSLSELESRFEKADKATLFRTLKTFEEKKLIHSIEDGTGAMKYALCQDTCECHPKDLHVHFHCTSCGQTYCLNNTQVPGINLPQDFTLQSVSMVVKGLCNDCKK